MPRARSRRRRPALAPAVVFAALLIGGGVLALVGRDDDDPPEPLTIVPPGVEEGPEAPPPLDEEVAAYRIVYRVEARAERGSIVDTEVREVRRPFEARAETLTGEPPGKDLTALSIWAFGVTEVGAPDQERATLVGEPVLPNGDVGLAPDIDAAIDEGVLVYLGERQEIAGRTCHRYRTGGPTDVVRLTAPTTTDYADLCVDGAGLVLGESWVVDSQLFRRRTAVEVEIDPTFAADAFEPLGRPPSFRDGGGLIGEVTPDSQFPDVDHWALPAPPAGFELRGRFSFTPSAAGNAAAELGTNPPIVTGLSDVYERDGNAIVIVNGGTNDESDSLGDLGDDTVELGELGTGHLRRRVRGTEILVRLEAGRFVKIVGTGPVADLVAIGRRLERLDGAGKTITAEPDGEDLPGPEPS